MPQVSIWMLRGMLQFCKPLVRRPRTSGSAPAPQSIPPAFQESGFNPSFASDLTRFIIESNARLWVHGHIHSHSDYAVGNTRVLANPRGYPGELRTGFDPGLVVEV